MSTSKALFDSTLGPRGDHVHAILRLTEGIPGAQAWVDGLLPGQARVRHSLPGFQAVALRCPPAALEVLTARPEVVSAHPDLRVTACLDTSAAAVRAPALWEEGFTGRDVRVALLDTGIDRGHTDFEGRIGALEDFTGCGVRDDHGHGTFVASVAAGSGEASRGRYRGVAPGATLLVARVLDSEGKARESDVMAGLLWALTREARVVNLSLATEAPAAPDDALAWAVGELARRGVLVCAASGAPGPQPSPASAAGALRVAGYDPSKEAPVAGALDTAQLPLAAPGRGVVAARAFGTSCGRAVGEVYCEGGGASAASAHVAGVCALLLEAAPDASAEHIAAALRAGAQPRGDGCLAVNALAALADLRVRR